MEFLFRRLDVYQQAVDFAEKAGQLTGDFARPHIYMADQLNRAALSICANIAEGNGRRKKPDRAHYFVMARGSVFECVAILEVGYRKKLFSKEDCLQASASLEKIACMLSGLIGASV